MQLEIRAGTMWALMAKRKTHKPMELPEEWIARIQEWRNARRMTLEELGQAAGEAIGESPFSQATMSRFLSNTATTQEVAEALSALTGYHLPSSLELEEPFALWLDLGRRLYSVNQRHFQDELYEIRLVVEALERTSMRRKKIP